MVLKKKLLKKSAKLLRQRENTRKNRMTKQLTKILICKSSIKILTMILKIKKKVLLKEAKIEKKERDAKENNKMITVIMKLISNSHNRILQKKIPQPKIAKRKRERRMVLQIRLHHLRNRKRARKTNLLNLNGMIKKKKRRKRRVEEEDNRPLHQLLKRKNLWN